MCIIYTANLRLADERERLIYAAGLSILCVRAAYSLIYLYTFLTIAGARVIYGCREKKFVVKRSAGYF